MEFYGNYAGVQPLQSVVHPAHPDLMEYTDMNYPIKYPTPSPSSDASQSPTYMQLGNMNEATQSSLLHDFESMNCNMPTTTGQYGECHLTILEQPVEKFRFRYKSEMSGTHGSLQGSSSEKNRKATYPTVQLKHYNLPATVRCSLYSYSKEAPENCRIPHPHRLVMKDDTEEVVDPHDKNIDLGSHPNMKVVFKSMGIIHTAKKHIFEELKIKKSKLKLEELRRIDPTKTAISTRDEAEITQQINDEEKSLNLNVVCLRFDAFRRDQNDVLHRICEPIYSNPIFNLKSAMTGDLKIVRMDHATSPASGGKEIFLLVEKVAKKNIKVQLFELDENDEKIWCADAKFHETDVHHQYAIVVKTPPYRNLSLDECTKDVFISLFRPSDGECSEPRPFTYTPDKTSKRKRTRYDYESSSSMSLSRSTEMNEVPLMVLGMHQPMLASDELLRLAPQVNSEEFNRMLPEVIPEIKQYFPCEPVNDSLHFDAVSKGDAQSIEKDLSKIRKQYYQIGAYIKSGQPNTENMLQSQFDDKNLDKNGNNILHLCHIHYKEDLAKKLKTTILGLIERLKLYDLLNIQNYDNESILTMAIKNGPEAKQLEDLPLEHMKLDAKSASPLHFAIKNNYGIDELCTHFKSQGVLENVNHGENRLTPLQYAVEKYKLPVVKKLVQYGAQVNVQDNRTGNNILHTAILSQHEDLIEYLIKNTTVKKNSMNYDDKTPEMLVKEVMVGLKQFNIMKMLDPERVTNNFEMFESALVKCEREESSSDSEEEMVEEVEIKTEDIPFDEDMVVSFDLVRDLSKIAVERSTVNKLYEDLNFGYMLETDAFEDRNPLEFLIHLALTNNVRVGEIRESMQKHGIMEAVHCIDQMLNSR